MVDPPEVTFGQLLINGGVGDKKFVSASGDQYVVMDRSPTAVRHDMDSPTRVRVMYERRGGAKSEYEDYRHMAHCLSDKLVTS